MSNNTKRKNILANFLFEAQVLKRVQRTGWQILGENEESISEHLYLTSIITFILAKQMKVNTEKVLTMALFHDFHETRVGDVDKIGLNYLKRDVEKANKDIFEKLSFGKELLQLLIEYEEKKSLEAKLVYEANVIALTIELKTLVDKGSIHAKEWLEANKERVRLKESKALIKEIMHTDSQDFWKEIRDKLHGSFKK
ncbi:HD domain-containing protein [Candidatus Roizmanbacteria bacterium]|nr:HD domain-containing protein [Candidatus Roizmanbacteria bacterium]MBI4008846.1 HD domain-containing protein [Candidatus Roizmanbacteria bacterium]